MHPVDPVGTGLGFAGVAIPRYRELTADRCAPHRSAWGVFGPDDEIGTLNFIGPEETARGAALVREGQVFPLNWRLDQPDPPILGRSRMHRTQKLLDPGPNPGTDDIYDNFFTQGSTQWDALCHVGHPDYGYYNGRVFADLGVAGGRHLGIDQWARRGIATRFVLADVARHRLARGRPLPCSERVVVTVGEIEEVLLSEGLSITPGDVLLVRFGWIGWYEQLDEEGRAALLDPLFFPAPGLSPEERTAEWLWDHRVAAVAADSPTLEAMPFDKASVETFLHYRLVVFLGMAIGELFDLEALAEHASRTGTYEGLFVAAPLNFPGGAGSPANALAIK